MTRLAGGGGIADFVIVQDAVSGDIESAPAGTVVTFWDSLTGGNQYGPRPDPDNGTGLCDGAGNPISSVTTDADGFLADSSFMFPDLDATGVTRMAADASGGSGPRRWIAPNDPLAVAVAARQQAQANGTALAFLNSVALPVVQYQQQTGAYPPRPSGVGGMVLWIGPIAPAIGGTGAVDGLDLWIQTTS